MRTSQEWFNDTVVSVQLPGGRRMRLAGIAENYLTFELFWRGLDYYEPISLVVTQELAREASHFVDIGANIGIYSLVLGLLAPHLNIAAFEPNPKAYELLRTNLRLNHLDLVRCEPIALSDSEGTATLYMCPSDMSASLERDFESTTGGREVRKTTLDSYLAGWLGSKLLLKVDVEGHESALFRGGLDVIHRHRPDILCEITGPLDPDVISYLRRAGYGFYAVTHRGLLTKDEPQITVDGPYLFLNYLFTTAPEPELQALFGRIESKVRNIDLDNTSKKVDPAMIERLQSRQTLHQ